MKREELIKKWLDNSLSPEEFEAFKVLEDYEALTKLSKGLKQFKAPDFNTSEALESVLSKRDISKTPTRWLSIGLKIAAVFVICFGIYFYMTPQTTTITTEIAEQRSIVLPDNSNVTLNALSSLSYNPQEWNKNRNLNLKGEAFFKVAKGQQFSVETKQGTVTVYGTQFNVNQRENLFEVICYEGLVGVTYNNKETKLNPGDHFLILNEKIIATEKENQSQPSWVTGTSSFKSLPYYNVLREFERQYNVTIRAKDIDTSQLFTGHFSHKDMESALQSITLPLHLTFEKNDNIIRLKREQ